MGLGPSTVLGVIYGVTSGAADPVLVYTKHERANQGDSISGATVGSGVLTGSPYTISNLTNGTEYEVQVQAMNTLTEFGEWSMSQFVTPVVSALPAIDAPSLPTLSSTTSTSVSFAWTAVTGAEKYGVQLRTGTGAWDGPHEVLTGTSYTAATLSPDTRYEFQVAAYGDGTTRRAAWGDWSPSLEADTAVDPTPQTCVTDLGSIEGASYGSADGEWTADCDSTHRPGKYAKFFTFEIPAAAEVTIELVGSEDPFLFLLEGSGTSGSILKKNDDSRDSTLGWTNSRIVRTLAAGTYTAEATTFNNNTTGTFNLAVDNELYEPTEPTHVDATGDDGEIVVAWNPPVRNGGEPVTDYRVQYGTASNGSAWTPTGWQSTFLAHTKTITGLDNGITYYVAVQARNDIDPADGDGALSEAVTAVPQAQGAPGAPSNVELIVRDQEIEVDWDAPTSDGGSPVTGHQFRYRVHGTQSWAETAEYTNGTRAGRSVSPTIPLADRVIGGLTNGTSYDVEVHVRNSNGYGPWAAPQTQWAAPATPIIEITDLNDAMLQVGDQTSFSVRASNLASTGIYTVSVSTNSSDENENVLKFGACDFDGPNETELYSGDGAVALMIRRMTVSGCADGADYLIAKLVQGNSEIASASRSISVADMNNTTGTAWRTHLSSGSGAGAEAGRYGYDRGTEDAYGVFQGAFGSIFDGTFTFATRSYRIDHLKWDAADDELSVRFSQCLAHSEIRQIQIGSEVYLTVSDHTWSVQECVADRNQPQTLTYSAPNNSMPSGQTAAVILTFANNDAVLPPVDAPDGVTVGSATTDSIEIIWLAADYSDKYKTRIQKIGASSWAYAETTDLTHTFTTLESGKEYRFQVQSNGDGTNRTDGWGDWTDEMTSYTHPSQPARPTDIRANGKSPAVGVALIRWAPVDGATSYRIQHKEADSNPWPADNDFLPSPGNELTISGVTFAQSAVPGLTSESNHQFRVRSVATVGNLHSLSDWSDEVVWAWVSVNLVPDSTWYYDAFPNGLYEFTICDGTFGSLGTQWSTEIETGIETWQEAVTWLKPNGDNIIRTTKIATGDCVDGREFSNNVVKGINGEGDFRVACFGTSDEQILTDEQEDATACTRQSSDGTVRSIFYYTGSYWNPADSTPDCSDVHRFAAHEAGHALGYRPHLTNGHYLMLANVPTNICEPTFSDALALMALYQLTN